MVESSRKYQEGKIYFIGNFVDDDIYIGSTCQPLGKRFRNHKDTMNNEVKMGRKLYTKMRHLGVEHFYIEELEKYPCLNNEELKKRERYYIMERQPILNIAIPTRTKEEWTEDNRERKREMDRNHYFNNKEKYNELSKQWREEHPELMKEYKTKWYENNKEDMSRKSKERMTCECGVEVCRGAFTRHCKTKRHQNYLNNNIENV